MAPAFKDIVKKRVFPNAPGARGGLRGGRSFGSSPDLVRQVGGGRGREIQGGEGDEGVGSGRGEGITRGKTVGDLRGPPGEKGNDV